ncbi:MAG: amidohydrolase family protein [Proteobacteria bacterium]|nr:amidohydrolase family protein [Pseudomonadota bacterium]
MNTRHSKIHRIARATWLLPLLLIASCASVAQSAGNSGFVIANARVFDGTRVLDGFHVVVRDRLISEISDSSELPGGLEIIDAGGMTLMPGMIDTHTHTSSVTQLQTALRFGVTTNLDQMTWPGVFPVLKMAAETRDDVADFLSTDMLATPPGGHGTEYDIVIPTVDGPLQADAFVAERLANGADYQKIVLNGARAMNGMPTMSAATTRALVEAAHKRNLKVVAHIETPDDVRTVIDAGADGLAHIWRTSGAEPELSKLLAEHGMFVTATLSVPDGFVMGSARALIAKDPAVTPYLDDEMIANLTAGNENQNLENLDQFLDAVRGLHDAGVMLVAGTDPPNAGVMHGISMHRELELLVQAGLSPVEALSAATANAADAFALADRGRIAVGLLADLVLIDGNPTRDITDSRQIARVWRNGVEFDRSLPASLAAIADGDHRSEASRARNHYRHPVETLEFIGIKPDMTIVEISPGGGGWYTEILAPYLKDNGKLYAASFDPDSESNYFRSNAEKFNAKLAADPGSYSKVEVTVFDPPLLLAIAPPGSADMVLTFRNVHNWMREGVAPEALAGMYAALKPGGILGVVAHRADPGNEQDPKVVSGYVRQDYVIKLAESAGFEFVESGEINANPNDSRDHPEGVWTLPPSLRLKDVDRDKYLAIGESDRMTLKFRKPD